MNTACCTNASKAAPYDAGPFQHRSVSRASINTQASAGISLVTADGDKVTISAKSSVRASANTYDAVGRLRGHTAAIHREQSNVTAHSKIALTVEGTLDEAERADIDKLLETLAAAADDIFAGDSAAGVAELAAIADLGSIASFEAKLTYSQQISALARSRQWGALPAQVVAAPGSTDAADGDPLIDQLAKLTQLLESQNGLAAIAEQLNQLLDELPERTQLLNHAQQQAA